MGMLLGSQYTNYFSKFINDFDASSHDLLYYIINQMTNFIICFRNNALIGNFKINISQTQHAIQLGSDALLIVISHY